MMMGILGSKVLCKEEEEDPKVQGKGKKVGGVDEVESNGVSDGGGALL